MSNVYLCRLNIVDEYSNTLCKLYIPTDKIKTLLLDGKIAYGIRNNITIIYLADCKDEISGLIRMCDYNSEQIMAYLNV